MSGGSRPEEWPETDTEGRLVRFISRDHASPGDDPAPVLRGTTVRLQPLQEDHLEALCEIGLQQSVTRFMPVRLGTRDQMAAYIRDAVAARAARTAVPFVIVLTGEEKVVGTTRYMNIDRANRHLEIGSTWIGLPWQRTGVNTEAKYLLLRHAFEERGCLRVEFKTDSLNTRSRAALLRIGAVQEGVFRSHVVTDEGRVRHSVWFSITAEDWPGVRHRLEALIGGPAVERPAGPGA